MGNGRNLGRQFLDETLGQVFPFFDARDGLLQDGSREGVVEIIFIATRKDIYLDDDELFRRDRSSYLVHQRGFHKFVFHNTVNYIGFLIVKNWRIIESFIPLIL